MFVSGSDGEGAALAAWQGCAAGGGEHRWGGLVVQLPGQGGLRGGVVHAPLCTVKLAHLLRGVLCCTWPWHIGTQSSV